MSRNGRKNEKALSVHPSIEDIEVTHQNTSINLRKSAMSSGRKLPDHLHATAKYNFGSTSVELHFSTEEFEFEILFIAGYYDFNKINISQAEFVDVPYTSFLKLKVFKLNTFRIDRHVLIKQFTVSISYKFQQDIDGRIYNSKYTFELPYFQRDTRLMFKFLDQFHADSRITALYNYNFRYHPEMPQDSKEFLRELEECQRQKSSSDSLEMIKYAMNIEDLSSQDEMKEYTLKNVKVEGSSGNYWFYVMRNQLPNSFAEMSLCLTPMTNQAGQDNSSGEGSFFVQIDKFANDRIMFEKKSSPAPAKDESYIVKFIPNRISYRACLQALDTMKKNVMTAFFDDFDVMPEYSKKINGDTVDDFQWFNKQIATNEEQKTAIKNIVNCTAYPFPFVCFGPAGTGKTSCLVECIAQILAEKETSHILVTAQSNSACDEIGDRLLKYVSRNKVFRFYSQSLLNPACGETSTLLRETSNIRGKENQYPTKEEFYHFNVVIVTLMSSSRLVQLSGIEINRHFDYILVDEAGAATQPETYVPIIGLGTDYREVTANIVLFGDHKQLGPVISNDMAVRLGLGESLMERIMSKKRYLINPSDKNYDEKYVTQLLDNFRSHPAILQFSNVLFYNSKLRAKIVEPEKSLGTRWSYLKNKKFPVVFHCVTTSSQTIRNGTSSFNEGEIKVVRFYVDLLLQEGIDGVKIAQEDIGIVSPYKAQLNKLRDELSRERKVEIGTTEYYQGREKKIIIISTVKSRDTVGFLKSEKRLNVCFTRAKSLLIIVGNADTLQQNSMWNQFIQFCKINDGCYGDKFNLRTMTAEEREVQNELNSIFKNTTAEHTSSNARKQAICDRMEDTRQKLKMKKT